MTEVLTCSLCRITVPADKVDAPNRCLYRWCPLNIESAKKKERDHGSP